MDKESVSPLDRAVDRRAFLRGCGALGVGALAGGALQSVFRVVPIDRGRLQIEQTLIRMGTYVTLTAVDESRARAEEAIARAVQEMDRLVAILSRHDPSTPLSHLNRQGTLRDGPPELLEVVRRSLWTHRVSGGAFDVTVKPVLDLFPEDGSLDAAMPSDAAVHAALAHVGSSKLEVGDRHVRLAEAGMGVTLDGIAKGFIVDRMSEVLAGNGVANHLVNAGGDIRARGLRSDGGRWHIAVEDPQRKGRYPAVIQLGTGAVATSGNYEIYFDRQKIHHHIIDPGSGTSPARSASVSVISTSATVADALATAIFVMKPERGIALVDSLAGNECLIIGRNDESHRSAGWDAFTARGDHRAVLRERG
jgi:thiamine biosynthesis lipoprotein